MITRIIPLRPLPAVCLAIALVSSLAAAPARRHPETIRTGDWLVPPANADFAARMIVHGPLETIRLPGQSHMIQWQRPDVIRDAVLHRLDRPARRP